MKRFLSFLLVVLIMLNSLGVVSLAADSTSAPTEDKYASDGDIGEISSCLYHYDTKKVSVSGSVDHDVMVTHDDYRIALYSVPNGKTLGDVIDIKGSKPLASAAISVKFDFLVDAKSNVERFSKYAVVIYNDKGDIRLIEEPKYPSVKSDYEYKAGDKSYYKGVSTELTSNATDARSDTSIIPVYLEKLLSNGSAGYVYPLQGTYIYFDKDYIGQLDARVRSISAIGGRVYLQFLLSHGTDCGLEVIEGESTDKYDMPNMSSEQTVNLISAFASFLCDRYSSESAGKIYGLILGRGVDGYSGKIDAYAENYSHYMLVAGTVARSYISELDVVVPLSDKNSYSQQTDTTETTMLDIICKFFDESVANLFAFSTLVETESVPYGISDETIKSGSFAVGGYDGINADNANVFSNYLQILDKKYRNSPDSFIFVWSVPRGISGNVLTCAYAYTYFKLLSNDAISTFAVSFSDAESLSDYRLYPEISNIFKYIDTRESFNVTADQLKLLRAGNWYAVIDGMYSGRLDRSRILKLRELSAVPENIMGSYAYYDFSYYTNLSLWFKGNSCDSLKIDYNDISGRSLEAHFDGEVRSASEYSEIFCSYDYPENLVFTPYISFNLSLENDSENKNSLYEIKLVLGSGKNTAEVSRICRGYEAVDLMVDISEFSEISMVDYIKIGVRCLTSDEDGFSLYLASIKGFSDKYSSEELERLISDERLRIRDMLEDDGETAGVVNTVLIVAGVAVVIVVIGIGVFMCFKREEEE